MGHPIVPRRVSAGSHLPFPALSLHLKGWVQVAMIILQMGWVAGQNKATNVSLLKIWNED